jgi:hypothetical protein
MKHLLLLAPLVGCALFLGHGPHVPSDYQGTTQVTVTNAWDHELCAFSVFKDGDGNENWLGDKSKKQNIAPGASRVFSIKPGTYHVIGGFCEGGDQLVGAVGTYGAATKAIEGPTLIALGPKPVAPIAGMHKLAFAKVLAIQQTQGGAEGGAEEPAAEEPTEGATESAPASSSSSSSSEAAAPSGPTCLAHGAVCDDDHHCCSGMSCASRTKFSDGSFGNGYCQ